jgi:hypothetical protein
MLKEAKQPLPEGFVLHLPPPKNAPRHLFGEAVTIPADISPTGIEQKEKTCQVCGAVRVTIIGGEIPRAWRIKGDDVQRPFEPVCRVGE